MDIHSLVTAHLDAPQRPARMNAEVEDRYYAQQFQLPRLRPAVLGPIALVVCAVVLFVGLVPG